MRQRMLMTTVFQFHKGTIKTWLCVAVPNTALFISIP